MDEREAKGDFAIGVRKAGGDVAEKVPERIDVDLAEKGGRRADAD